ncbi:hypothetical protein MTO96_036720 [Rhipicephalus appendiculatus]
MASAWLLVGTLSAFCACSWGIVLPRFDILSHRHDLATYQDIGKCTTQGATWHVLYRNVKEGSFGADDHCLRDTQLSEVVNGKARFRFRFGDGHERNATFTFKSSDGTNLNKIEAQVDGAKDLVKYDVLYVDCDHCKVMKNSGK